MILRRVDSYLKIGSPKEARKSEIYVPRTSREEGRGRLIFCLRSEHVDLKIYRANNSEFCDKEESLENLLINSNQ